MKIFKKFVKCKNCEELADLINNPSTELYDNWIQVYDCMRKMYIDNKLDFHLSDAPFDTFLEEVALEKQLTYYLYMKCPECNKYFELAICIRGSKPVFNASYKEPDYQQFLNRNNRDGLNTYYKTKWDIE